MEELEKNETSTQAEENTVSLASAQALADALAKIEVYTPTTWVDNSSPDIDAEHLNKPEQAIKRVTDALNSAVDVIKDLQSQVTKNSGAISDVNNNLSKYNFNLGDTTADNHEKIDRIATFSGFTWINKNYNSKFGGQWCFVDSFLITEVAAMQRITSAQTSTILATRYCEKNVWGDWDIGVTKSDFICGESIISANTGSTNVTFPQAFNNIPVVVAVAKGASKYVMLVVKVESISKSGFMVTAVTFENGSTTPPSYDVTIEWIAMRKS